MPINTVTLGGYYRHPTYGTMRLYAAAWPDKGERGYAKLILPEQYGIWPNLRTEWQGTMERFLAEWIEPTTDSEATK